MIPVCHILKASSFLHGFEFHLHCFCEILEMATGNECILDINDQRGNEANELGAKQTKQITKDKH